MNKEFLYVGTYTDTNGNRILKIGTTNDLKVRRRQHNDYYRNKTKNHIMSSSSSFEYIWTHKLSRYNTKRYEDKNRDLWQEMGIGKFLRNDRFVVSEELEEVEITIRKTYKIALVQGDFFVQNFFHKSIDKWVKVWYNQRSQHQRQDRNFVRLYPSNFSR